MNTLQITAITHEELQAMIAGVAADAATKAIEGFLKVKQDPNEEVTITQIAELWHCTRITVSKRIKEHNVPTVKLGREVAIKRRYLEMIKRPKAKAE